MKIDLTYLRDMSAGNKALVIEMIEIFKRQVVEFVEQMSALNDKQDYENLGKLAHKAKSSISIMGLNDLAKDLKTFENIAKAGVETEKYPIFIGRFRDETSDAVAELDEVLNNIDIYI
ncbi:MAG: Hpt domain-containing protein [Bacteroidales bacterium]|nr:Hpt domain-containing protein [Bacteroidales bacterium]